MFSAGSALRVVAFDLDRLEASGNSATVVPRLATTPTGAAEFAVAADGTLVYADAPPGTGLTVRTLVWVDRMGREQPIAAPPRAYMHPRISPDGTRVALWADDQESDVWMWDLARRTLARFTFDPGIDNFRYGRRMGGAWSSVPTRNSSTLSLFWQAADGSGTPERLTQGPTSSLGLASGVPPDGRWAIFAATPPQGSRDVMMTPLTADGQVARSAQLSGSPREGALREVRPLVQTPFDERNGIVSPDGRWLAYESDASGRFEVYVRPFPNVGDGQWQVSTAGGYQPLWSRSGTELFYVGLDGALMTVQVEPRGTAWAAGTPVKLLEALYFTGGLGAVTTGRTYDVSPDGRRFLVIKQGDGGNQTSTPLRLSSCRTGSRN